MPPSLRRRNRRPTPDVRQDFSDDENDEIEADELLEDDDLPEDGAEEEQEVEEEEELEEEEDAASPSPSTTTPPSPIPPGFRDISALASWTVSSAKPGCSIPQLRHPSTSLFWQSDGPQPHHISIHFVKLVRIVGLRLYLDFDADESYTPTRIVFLAGSRPDDLVEWGEMRLEQPRGWVWADFSGVVDPESEDDDDDEEEGDGEGYEYEYDEDDDEDDDGDGTENDTPGQGDYTTDHDAAILSTFPRRLHNQRPRDPSARHHSSTSENDTRAPEPSTDTMMLDEDESFVTHSRVTQHRRLRAEAANTGPSTAVPQPQPQPVTPLPAWHTTTPQPSHTPTTATQAATHTTLLPPSSSSPLLPAPTPRLPLQDSSPHSRTADQPTTPAADRSRRPSRRKKKKKKKLPVLRAHLLQVRILENHQNGKDTHVRGLQIFAREDGRGTRGAGVNKGMMGSEIERDMGGGGGAGLRKGKGKGKGKEEREMAMGSSRKVVKGLSRSMWDVEPTLR